MNYINTPFNYTGSKINLLEQILPEMDYSKNIFIDMFAGGGSVYTNILDKYEKILVNDIIIELIEIHKQFLESDDIIQKTKNICPKKDDQEAFIKLRQSFNNDKTPEKLYALMLSCTNNMVRFNQKFEFNQTFGKRGFSEKTEKKILEYTSHIRKYKDKIYFSSKNFYDVVINKPSMVYLDPPYLETEAGYNSYFSNSDGNKLYKYCKELDKNGSSFMLSGVIGEHKNGKRSKLIDDLISDGYKYKILDYDYEKVARIKNNKKSNEIIIMNY
jgi:DNA adenine methylase Dam